MSLGERIKKEYTAKNLPPEPITVFGEALFLRRWRARDRALWERMVFRGKGKEAKADDDIFQAAVVVLSLVDGEGKFVFEPATVTDGKPHWTEAQLLEVGELDAAEISRVYDRCVELHGLSRDTVEELRKNSSPAPSNGSVTA